MEAALKTLLDWGGPLAALFIVIVGPLCAVIVHLYKRNTTLNDMRAEDLKTTLLIVERNNQAIASSETARLSLTAAVNEVVSAVAKMSDAQTATRERFKEQGDRMERRLEGIESAANEAASKAEAARSEVATLRNHQGRAP